MSTEIHTFNSLLGELNSGLNLSTKTHNYVIAQ